MSNIERTLQILEFILLAGIIPAIWKRIRFTEIPDRYRTGVKYLRLPIPEVINFGLKRYCSFYKTLFLHRNTTIRRNSRVAEKSCELRYTICYTYLFLTFLPLWRLPRLLNRLILKPQQWVSRLQCLVDPRQEFHRNLHAK